MTIWGVVVAFSVEQVILAVLGFLLVLLVIGAYRLWYEADDQVQAGLQTLWLLNMAEAERSDEFEISRILGNFLTAGMDIEQHPDSEAVREQAEVWIKTLSDFITLAYGIGEFAILLDSGPPLNEDPEPVARVSGYMNHIRLLLHSRAKTLGVSPALDLGTWTAALDQALQENETGAEG